MEFPIGETIKLYLVLGNYNVGQTVQFSFEADLEGERMIMTRVW